MIPAASLTRMMFGSVSSLSLSPNCARGPSPNPASSSSLLVTGDVQVACPMRIGL